MSGKKGTQEAGRPMGSDADTAFAKLADVPSNGATTPTPLQPGAGAVVVDQPPPVGNDVVEEFAAEAPHQTSRGAVVSPPPPPPPERRPTAVRRPVPMVQPAAQRPAPRRPFALAFQNTDDTILVFRLENDHWEMLPKEWPRHYLDSVGLNIESFLIKHIVPDWGGGEYLVRGMSAKGDMVGEVTTKIAGASKVPQQASPGAQLPPGVPPAPQGTDPRAWAEAFSVMRSMGVTGTGAQMDYPQALVQIRALKEMRRLEKEEGESSPDKQALKAEFDQRIAALEAAITNALASKAAAVPAPDPIDGYIKLKQAFGADRPAQLDPLDQMLKYKDILFGPFNEALKNLATTVEKLAEKVANQQQQAQQQAQQAPRGGLRELLREFKEAGSELKEVTDALSPPQAPGGSVSDVVGRVLSDWSPQAIGELIERNATARVAIEEAEAHRELAKRVAARGQVPPRRPPLERFLSVNQRQALVKASTDEEVLDAIAPIVTRLYEVRDLREAFHKLFRALKIEHHEGLRAQLSMLVRGIYGHKDPVLVEKVATALVRNSADVIQQVEVLMGGGDDNGEGEVVEGEVVSSSATAPAAAQQPPQPAPPAPPVAPQPQRSKKKREQPAPEAPKQG